MFLFPSVDEVECDVVMLNSDQITSFDREWVRQVNNYLWELALLFSCYFSW